MKNIINCLFALLPFISNAQPTDARGIKPINDTSKNNGTTYAIVIGISKYKEVMPLNFADRDAQVFADYLLSKTGLALDSNNVKLFTNENATADNIGNALTDIIMKDLKKGDKVIFFFAGHGDYEAKILKDRALLLLYGAPAKNYYQNILRGEFISTAVLNSDFIDPLSSKGCEVMLFIDACHATGLNKNLSGGQEGGRITSTALQNMTSPVKIYSCQANQYSLESTQWGGGRGLFSYILMEGLYGMADADGNKIVTLRELQRYLEDNVPKMAAPNKQDPVIKIDDATEPIAKVNDDFLVSYKTGKEKTLLFIAKATIKGEFDYSNQNMDSLPMKWYKECDSLIEKKELGNAYEKFLLFAKTDSSSESSIHLRRNLSAALQHNTENILTPLLQDFSKYKASMNEIEQAEKDLERASYLLGQHHFLYKNLQARLLFLKALMLEGGHNKKTNLDNAIGYLDESIALEPAAPYTYFELADCYSNRNDLGKAIPNYEKYLAIIPNSSWAHYNLGKAYYDLKKYNQSIKYYSGAIEIDNHFSDAYSNLGLVYYALKNYNSAIKNYKKAIELNQNDASTYYNLGIAYDDMKNYKEAIFAYKKAITLDPNLAEAYNGLGTVNEELQNYAEAIRDCKKAIELNPNFARAHNHLGIVFYDLKQYNKAIEESKKAVALDPNLAEAYNSLGVTYDEIKNYSEAISNYEMAIKVDPNYMSGFYNLACLYSTQKNPTKSLRYFDQALKKKYKDLHGMESDEDLNNIRALPEFKAIMLKYFTQKELDNYPGMFVQKNR